MSFQSRSVIAGRLADLPRMLRCRRLPIVPPSTTCTAAATHSATATGCPAHVMAQDPREADSRIMHALLRPCSCGRVWKALSRCRGSEAPLVHAWHACIRGLLATATQRAELNPMCKRRHAQIATY